MIDLPWAANLHNNAVQGGNIVVPTATHASLTILFGGLGVIAAARRMRASQA